MRRICGGRFGCLSLAVGLCVGIGSDGGGLSARVEAEEFRAVAVSGVRDGRSRSCGAGAET